MEGPAHAVPCVARAALTVAQSLRMVGAEGNDVGREFGLRCLTLVQQFQSELELIEEHQTADRTRNVGPRAHDTSYVPQQLPTMRSSARRARIDHLLDSVESPGKLTHCRSEK